MKKLAIIIFIIIALPTLTLFMLGLIASGQTIISLSFSLLSFLIISNHDSIEIEYKKAKLKTFKNTVDEITEKAIQKLKEDVFMLRGDLLEHIEDTKELVEDTMQEAIEEAKDN